MNQHIQQTASLLTRALDHRRVICGELEKRRPGQEILRQNLRAVTHVIRGVTREGLIEIAGEEAFQ